ncbi:MAG: DUF11 domain-containing protein [Candidatus Levybacteria bacterium]|nr:DUF11 domain-containing protein [Candidatus Levybacteria bacterium]
MKKLFAIILLSVLFFAFKVSAANAAGCTPVYGGGETCPGYSYSIQKLVQRPGKGGGDFVNNLSINDAKYNPSQNVTFQVTLKNTGSNTIPTITVTDVFPKYLSFVSGPGNFNAKTKTLVFSVASFKPGQSVTYTIVGKILDEAGLPKDEGVICQLNQATATDSSGVVNSSSSQFCLQKQVLGETTKGGLPVMPAPEITTTPATGPEMLPLALLVPGALGGLLLRRRSKRSLITGGEK